jgi:transcriptional regulator with PAS, ATPase and Fis domain
MKPFALLDPCLVLESHKWGHIERLCDRPVSCQSDFSEALEQTLIRHQHVLVVAPIADLARISGCVASVSAGYQSPQITILVGHSGDSSILRLDASPNSAHGPFQALLAALDDKPTNERENELVGDSREFRGVIEQLRSVGRAPSNVVVCGESGTGKELAARLIHTSSGRSTKALVCVNCAAMPDALIESQMFGHERGAFTGADRAQDGAFLAANGGTLVLDEVADLSPAAQAKLLRAIESKCVSRLGSHREIKIDTRIVAISNKPLETLVEKGSFRHDLYYRLNVVNIEMPALRHRLDDLPCLVYHFLKTFSGVFQNRVEEATNEVLELFQRYCWPGNIRELRNVIEGAFVNRPRMVLTVDDLPHTFLRHVERREPETRSERSAVLSALEECSWNKSRAASQLHWSRVTLYRKMAKYQLATPVQPLHR